MNELSNESSGNQDDAVSSLFGGTRYRLESRLASGHAGELFVVKHVELGKSFAAKLLRREFATDRRVMDRLRLEAQALGRLRHPNVVGITGFDRTSDGRPFIVMELLSGRSLADELAWRGALPVAEALEWMRQILAALDAVHAIGIVHRDVQPKHLFLHEPMTGPRILRLVDFGVARVVAGTSERSPRPLAVPTKTGVVVGNPEFASPESVRGGEIDCRSDLYQAGLVLYHLLTGRGPHYLSADGEAGIGRISSLPEPPSRRSSDGLPAELDAIVLRALAEDPDKRFQSALDFGCALSALQSSISPGPLTRGEDDTNRDAKLQQACAPVGRAGDAEAPQQDAVTKPHPFGRTLLFVMLSAIVALLVVVAGRWLRGMR